MRLKFHTPSSCWVGHHKYSLPEVSKQLQSEWFREDIRQLFLGRDSVDGYGAIRNLTLIRIFGS